MFQISLSTPKTAVSALSALAAIGAAGMASQATAATIDVGKPTAAAWQRYLVNYPGWGTYGEPDWITNADWQSVRHDVPSSPSSYENIRTGYLNWNYDFAASDPIVSATLTIEGYGNGNPTYGFVNGSHIVVGSLTSAWNQSAVDNPVTATVVMASPLDTDYFVSINIDITPLAQAWKADPSSFHGVSFYSPDSPAGVFAFGPGSDIYGNNGRLTLVTEVPEPASIGLIGVGGYLVLRRRRK